MPQLNKGGKYVFGLSAISNRREILFPAETLEQYPVQKEGRIIIFTGSKITGGFCVTSKQLLGQSKLKHILDDCPALSQYTIDEGEFVRYKGRGYTWLHISQNGVVRLPENTMRYLNLSCGDILMSIKSSDIAFTMGNFQEWYRCGFLIVFYCRRQDIIPTQYDSYPYCPQQVTRYSLI